MKNHKKLSVKELAYRKTLTHEEETKIQLIKNMKKRYGIPEYIDSASRKTKAEKQVEEDNKIFLSVTSQYKSVAEYHRDIYTAYTLINEGKPIPPELDKKLIITKQELEQASLLEKFACI